MTFAEFQASRRASPDIGEAIGANMGDTPVAGFIYLDTLWIESTASWGDDDKAKAAKERGAYYLILTRDDYLSDDLGELEARLYLYAIDHLGYADEGHPLHPDYVAPATP